MSESSPDESSWTPQDPAVLRDQRAAYDEMRAQCPVAHSDALGWSVFRHDDVTAIAGDPRTFSSATRHLAIPNGMDSPDHTVYRQALESHFLPDRLVAFEPTSRRIARDLLAGLAGRSEAEAIDGFVDPFAHQALCAFMGWPVEDWNRISGWTHGNQEAAFRRDREAGARLAAEFAGYVTAILESRRRDASASDLMAALVRTRVHDQPLTNDQIVGLLRTWTAGHGTVASGLGIVIHQLSKDQDLQANLRAEPGMLDAAIREILRADGPLVANNRRPTRDVTIRGRSIAAGEPISMMWIAANRDPAAFDDPDRVVVDRDPSSNFLFGTGIHRCLGESLAVLDMKIGLAELLRGTAAFGLAPSSKPVRHVYPSNGFSELPLLIRPAGSTGRGASGRTSS
ncbi:MAG TPA: cytochrome P450 [Candidatus Limnocylindrales bacterium]|nr:cytochrome P450 [Candidatus Limnocylindrales bacterium]